MGFKVVFQSDIKPDSISIKSKNDLGRFTLFGLKKEKDEPEKRVNLGSYLWDNKGEEVQEFGIKKVMKVGGVEVEGKGKGEVCLERFRVYGN